MKHPILNSEELGSGVGAVRKTSRVGEDELAVMAGVRRLCVAGGGRGARRRASAREDG